MTSARDELHESICSCSYKNPAPGECDSVDQIIDNFAHELAEETRKSASSGTLFVQDIILGMTIAADLIDPEVN